jgi:hypothetical protein
MTRPRDDIRMYFCPKCGHRWEKRVVHCGRLRHRLGGWGCALVVMALLLFTLCLAKILGWL